jgi:hypothetical protein
MSFNSFIIFHFGKPGTHCQIAQYGTALGGSGQIAPGGVEPCL